MQYSQWNSLSLQWKGVPSLYVCMSMFLSVHFVSQLQQMYRILSWICITVFKISAGPQTLTGKIWVGPARFGKLSFFIIYKFSQNCASVRQVSDLILKTGISMHICAYIHMHGKNTFLVVFRCYPVAVLTQYCVQHGNDNDKTVVSLHTHNLRPKFSAKTVSTLTRKTPWQFALISVFPPGNSNPNSRMVMKLNT